jgi:hypothetical protein
MRHMRYLTGRGVPGAELNCSDRSKLRSRVPGAAQRHHSVSKTRVNAPMAVCR